MMESKNCSFSDGDVDYDEDKREEIKMRRKNEVKNKEKEREEEGKREEGEKEEEKGEGGRKKEDERKRASLLLCNSLGSKKQTPPTTYSCSSFPRLSFEEEEVKKKEEEKKEEKSRNKKQSPSKYLLGEEKKNLEEKISLLENYIQFLHSQLSFCPLTSNSEQVTDSPDSSSHLKQFQEFKNQESKETTTRSKSESHSLNCDTHSSLIPNKQTTKTVTHSQIVTTSPVPGKPDHEFFLEQEFQETLIVEQEQFKIQDQNLEDQNQEDQKMANNKRDRRSKSRDVTRKVTEIDPTSSIDGDQDEDNNNNGRSSVDIMALPAGVKTFIDDPADNGSMTHLMEQKKNKPINKCLSPSSPSPKSKSLMTQMVKKMNKASLKRLQMLKDRNSNLPPHLRSSYVVEELPGLEPEFCDHSVLVDRQR